MKNKVVKASVWYTISEVVLRGISFFTTPIFVRLLTKEEFGMVNNFTSWFSIMTIITTLNLHATIIRARYDFEDNQWGYTFSILILGSIFTLAIFSVILFFPDFFSELFVLKKKYIYLMFLCLLVWPSLNIFQVWQRIQYRYKSSIALSMTVAVLNIAVSLFLLDVIKEHDMARILGMQVPTLLASLVLYFYIWRKGKRVSLSHWKYALVICIPYLPHLLSLNILSSADRIMITKISGASYTAIYSLAYSCALVITMLLNAMNTAFSPWLGEKLYKKEYNSIKRVSSLYILFFIVCALCFMLIVPEILYIMGGAAYMEAKYVLAPLVSSCICQFLYCMYVNIEQYEKKTVGMAIVSVLTATLNIVLNCLLIPRFGYLVAAHTTLWSYTVLLFLHYLLVRRIKLQGVYDTKLIFFILIIIYIFTVLVTFLYQYTFLYRYLLLLVIFTSSFSMVVIHKNKLLAILNELEK